MAMTVILAFKVTAKAKKRPHLSGVAIFIGIRDWVGALASKPAGKNWGTDRQGAPACWNSVRRLRRRDAAGCGSIIESLRRGAIAMYDELTEVDIRKMQEEIDYRVRELRPQLIEEVQTARAFGDLSENYEYKCAKQAKNRNDSRIRYLERMIRTAKVIQVQEGRDAVSLFDKVTIFNEMVKKEMVIQIVTTLRQDALKGLVSKESPVGKALLGHRAGDRVQVEVSPELQYFVEIRAIEKGKDDDSLDISAY